MEANSSEKLLQQIRNCTNLVHRLIHREHHTMNSGIMGSGMGRGQGLVLRMLAENDGMTQSEIAEKLDIRPSSLGELVRKLVENGFVERRQNEKDKRVINVYLTEKGREIEGQFINKRQQSAESWCAGLSEDEKEQLSGLLGKLISSMEESMSKDGAGFSGQDMPFGHGHPGMGHEERSRHDLHSPGGHFGKRCGGHGNDWRGKL